MHDEPAAGIQGQGHALWMSTIAFTVCFAVWTLFAIIGIQIKQDLGLNETQFGLLVGTPILTGSLVRIFLGIWTDQVGGRRVYTVVMLAAALATFLLTYAHTYMKFLVAALGVVIAAMARIGASLMPAWSELLLHVTVLAWCVAFFGFAASFGPTLVGRRRASQIADSH